MKKDIYIIKNTLNDRVYVGQAVNSANRWMSHLSDARKKEKPYPIDAAIKKYGEQYFHYEILEYQIENYDEREKYWIQYYDCIAPKGYNICSGGKGVAYGIENPNAHFNATQIADIVNKLQNTKLSMENIAKEYQCALYTISSINLGKSYFNEKLSYPLRQSRYSKEKIKQIHYSLQYELDKSLNQIAKEYEIDKSQLHEINQGKLHPIPGKQYPLRDRRSFSINQDKVDDIIKLLQESEIPQKDIAKQFNVSRGFISSINLGSYYHQDGLQYPLRTNYQGNPVTTCLSPDELSQIEQDLLEQIKSVKTIASEHELAYSTVMNINNGSVIKYKKSNLQYPLRDLTKYRK